MAMEHSLKQNSRSYATKLDAEDPLQHLRAEFIIPTKADLKRSTLNASGIASLTLAIHSSENSSAVSNSEIDSEPCIYLCGNSLGLQPRRTIDRIHSHLSAWATKGVFGHFTEHEDSPLAPFLHVDGQAAKLMAPIVGALPDEIAVMETLTANLHLMMLSFYRPTKEKHKIIIEGKAFPSDHYAVESQITHHGFNPEDALILIEPENLEIATLTTAHILSVIDQHASSTALILLPGVQYYTGQYLDIKTITAHAHSYGIIIGWDLAHAVGNVNLHLHDWNADFAAWCNYKYLNSGPGAVAGLFVHSKHGNVDMSAVKRGQEGFRSRLCGWWGGDKAIRFEMGNRFVPIPGAQGFQVGNPSALAITAVIASLEIFELTTVDALRKKSVALTQYLEHLLVAAPAQKRPCHIITPSNPDERGAQLSIRLQPGLLGPVMEGLEDAGVVVDERKPDVVRVAPAPLYNTFTDVWDFVNIFSAICSKAQANGIRTEHSAIGMRGTDEKGWAAIK